jgi:hypothetical protein
MRDLARIDRAGDKDWRSLAWKLERRHPGEFADRSRQGGDVNVNFNMARIVASPEWHQLSERLLAVLAPFGTRLRRWRTSSPPPRLSTARRPNCQSSKREPQTRRVLAQRLETTRAATWTRQRTSSTKPRTSTAYATVTGGSDFRSSVVC